MIKNLTLLSIFILLFLPIDVLAEESQFIRTRGSLSIELNLLDSGNSMVFSPNDSGDTTKDNVGTQDRKNSYQKSNLDFYFIHDHGWLPWELWLNFNADSDTLMGAPNSVGLESTLLFPIYSLMPGLKIGFYHDSEHNLDKSLYGNGTNIDGLHLSLDILKDKKFPLNLWFTYIRDKDKDASPYIFTRNAKEMPRKNLGEFDWITGFKTHTIHEDNKFDLSVTLNTGDDGLASIKNRFVWSYEIDKVITLKLFTEYNRNLQKTDEFGLDEWLIGPGFEVKL